MSGPASRGAPATVHPDPPQERRVLPVDRHHAHRRPRLWITLRPPMRLPWRNQWAVAAADVTSLAICQHALHGLVFGLGERTCVVDVALSGDQGGSPGS